MFGALADWADIERNVVLDGASNKVIVRLHRGDAGVFAWFVNYDRETAHEVTAAIASRFGRFRSADVLWGDTKASLAAGNQLSVTVGAQDAVVVHLR